MSNRQEWATGLRQVAFMLHPFLTSALAALLLSGGGLAQEQSPQSNPQPAPASGNDWSFYGSAMTYLIPDDQSYVSPSFMADRKWLHLEARYNYENLRTGSLWFGRNFSFGNQLTLDVTPMIGGVFGRSAGVAPGYRAALSYKGLSLDTEGEYFFDGRDRTGNFFYTWSEFSYSPVDWLRIGAIIQRTKAYQTPLSVQRGVLAGFSYKNLDVTAYVLNFGWTDPTTVFAVGYRF